MSDSALWLQIDEYFEGHLDCDRELADSIFSANWAAELPAIDVSPLQAKWLSLMLQIQGAKRVLEIGTLGGFSTAWMARALPDDGQIVTLELEPKHAAVARDNLERAGCNDKVEILVGDANQLLSKLYEKIKAQSEERFDFVFIDADKRSNPAYFEWSMKLVRAGAVIVIDNVVRDGKILNAKTDDPDVQGVQRVVEMIGQTPGVTATAVQTVGKKDHDGYIVAYVHTPAE
ncbi:MAG: O-methyltransferase [Pirellulaceae bacterium]